MTSPIALLLDFIALTRSPTSTELEIMKEKSFFRVRKGVRLNS